MSDRTTEATMRVTMIGRAACAVVASLLLAAGSAGAQQEVGARVAAVRDGTVHLSFAARPGVCGNGRNIQSGGSRGERDQEWEHECEPGPVRVSLGVKEGAVTSVRAYVGGRWRAGGTATDLGTVSAPAAARYLLQLAERGQGRVARDAILPATLADSVTVWPDLLRLARDDARPRDVRKQAVFWVGQAAESAATAGLDELATSDADREVQESAVFALSQRPRHEGVPVLIRIARTSRDPQLRKQALFWLGQSDDPRALALFEELLARTP